MTAAITVRRILKVNHAGEYGAIRIYGAQIAVARRLYPAIGAPLSDIRAHEIEHCRLFREAMPVRGARPCRVMAFRSLGGYVLGFTTALLGERMISICTEAVERGVHRHLDDQLRYLEKRDADLKALISSIQDEELSHLHEAQGRRGPKGPVQGTAVVFIGRPDRPANLAFDLGRLDAHDPGNAICGQLIGAARAHPEARGARKHGLAHIEGSPMKSPWDRDDPRVFLAATF